MYLIIITDTNSQLAYLCFKYLITKTLIRKLIILICLLQSSFAFNQSKADSLAIVKIFTEALSSDTGQVDPLKAAKSMYQRNKTNKYFLDTYYIQWSKYLLLTSKSDSSILVSTLGIENAKKIGEYNQAKHLNLIASANSLKHNYKEGISYFEKSLKLMEKYDDEVSAAYVHNNISNLFFSLLDYESAYKHASQSFQKIKAFPNDPNYASIMSILSVAEAKLLKFEEAERHGKKAIEVAQQQNNIIALIIGNHTLGDVYLNKKQLLLSEKHFQISLDMSQKFGQNHFSLLNYIGLMNVNNELKNYQEAVDFGESGLELSIEQNNSDTKYSIGKGLAIGYAGLNNYEKAYELLLKTHEDFLKSNSAQNKKTINDILIKYDTEKKERDLSEMKLNFLNEEIQTARYVVAVMILFTALIIIFVILLFIKQRNKQAILLLKEEKQKQVLSALLSGEENERKRIALELHDGIASDLTAIRYQIEQLETGNESLKDGISHSISILQEEARRIAHNLSPLTIEEQGLFQALSNHITNNNYGACKLEFISNLTDACKFKPEFSLLIYRMIQELTHNAIKHAFASNIIIQVLLSRNEIRITIEDDGVGFDVEKGMKSNGLMGIAKRVQILKGSLNIDSSNEGGGTIVQIVLQLNNQ